MAPDIESLSSHKTGGYANNGVDRDASYQIPDVVLNSPATHKLRVLSIGAGVSGIMNAYKMQKHCGNVEHIIYEKNEDIGGTWLENRCPGCGCDIPSHAYTYNFALDVPTGRGSFPTHKTYSLILPKPDIEGMEKFKGRIIHTARWPKDYQAEEWKKDRVAVIGSGASSIQTVPTMQPHVKHMDVFVRTGIWFVQIANNYGQNYEYTAEQKEIFRHDTDELVKHAEDIEDQVNGLWGGFYKNSERGEMVQEMFTTRMKEWIKDERLLKGFTPKFSIGCRRITPGDPYMIAIQKPNVDVHSTLVTKIAENTIIGGDGPEREIDTIIGAHSVSLAEKWRDGPPEAYLGLAIPSLPNFLTFIGPNWPVENGSVMGPLAAVSDYAVQIIHKMQAESILSLTPKQEVTGQFNAHCQEWMRHTVWVENCRGWYKDNDTGRVNAVWPGASLHYCAVIERPRHEDFDIVDGTYPADGDGDGDGAGKQGRAGSRANMWAFLGMGTTTGLVLKQDSSPYLKRENIDPMWLEAVGCDERLKTGKKIGTSEKGTPTGLGENEGGAQTAK